MKRAAYCITCGLTAMVMFVQLGFSHCQVPCGIYGDQLRFDMMKEDIATVEKATGEITTLSQQGDKNYNQIVRWVNARDDHANKIMAAVSEYFLAQRIALPKSASDDKQYLQKLAVLHQMLVLAMKTKQSTDPAAVEKLKALVADFQTLYFEKK